jgi:hypothetical protein
MPEHLKALVVVLAAAIAVFAIAKAPACAVATATKDFDRRRNLWLVLTLAAFLSHSFWLCLALAGVCVVVAMQNEHNKLAMFFLVLFAIPPITADMPGMGLVNYLFVIDYVRLLALLVLFPAYLHLRKQPDTMAFGRTVPDKILAAYLILGFLLWSQHSTLTNALRNGVFYAFIDVFLPYYVASRSLKNIKDFRDALMAYTVAAMVLSLIVIFEFAKGWLLYPSVEVAQGITWGWNNYMWRGGNLRARGPIGHPIAAGYAIAVAIAFYLYLKKLVPNGALWGLGMLLLIGGLVAPVSRGPWVGAVGMVLVILATGRAPALALAKAGLIVVIAVPLLLITPSGQRIVDYLPFVGTIEASTVEGRQRLAETSIRLILDNPLFGIANYLELPDMEALRGGDGLIDLVNTYVIVGLGSGVVGLSLFIGFFVAAALCIYRGMRTISDKQDERYVLGQTLLATLLGILFIIGTVSPVLIIPNIYWAVAGLGVGYAGTLARRSVSTGEHSVRIGSARTSVGRV